MQFNKFNKWISDNFGGLTFAALLSKAGVGTGSLNIASLSAATTPLDDADLFVVSQGGVLKKVTYAELKLEINPPL